jgi:hypothetical protein
VREAAEGAGGRGAVTAAGRGRYLTVVAQTAPPFFSKKRWW